MSENTPFTPEFSRLITVSELRNTTNIQKISATAAERAALIKRFDLISLDMLEAKLTITPWRKKGWRITGNFTASLAQQCSATLEPADLMLSETLERGFLPKEHLQKIDGPEVEITFDEELEDAPEALGETIDLGELVAEAVSLSLPLYPRANGIEPVSIEAIPPGATSLQDQREKPFAQLAALKEKMDKNKP